MKPKVKIIFPGYESAENNGRSCSNVVLIRTDDRNIIVDPGTLPSQEILIEKLKQEKLSVADIDIVFLTHSHIDHTRNVGMFAIAKVLDFWGWWDGDLSSEYQNSDLEYIILYHTPGHSYDGVTLLVDSEDGKIAICGDVFWKKDYPKKDPFATDLKALKKSRKKVLKMADFVIPGHGEMFSTK